MKIPPNLFMATLFGAGLLVPSTLSAKNKLPTGFLNVSSHLVKAGEKPMLTWNVKYPGPPFEDGKTTEDVNIEVKVYGVAFEAGAGNKRSVSSRMKVGDTWIDLFTGKGSDVDPSKVLLKQTVKKGTPIKLAATGEGSEERHCSSKHIVILRNGDTPPDYAPAYNQGHVESFMSAYLENGKVKIGEDDIIYIAELYSETPGDAVYDMQDIVVHVKFERIKKSN